MTRPQIALLTGILVLVGGPSLAMATDPTPNRSNNIWQDDSQSRRGPGPRWHRWFSDETVDRIMKGIEKRDPEKAKELARLRKEEPEEFKFELGRHGRPEIEAISRERFEAWRERRRSEFVAWLKTNYPEQEKELTELKEKDPQLYLRSYEHIEAKYGRIFDADRANPELGAVLKEDLILKQRRDELIHLLRHEGSDVKRQELGTELEEVVARRYDLIVRRKQIAYEELQRKLEELQKQIKESKDEIIQWQDLDTRMENIRRRIEMLAKRKSRFRWD